MPVRLVVKDIVAVYDSHRATVTRARGSLRLLRLVDTKAAQKWAADVKAMPLVARLDRAQVQRMQREEKQALEQRYQRAAAGAFYPLPEVTRWGRSVLADVEAISRD